MKRGSVPLTVEELVADPLAAVAMKHWATAAATALDLGLVGSLFRDELAAGDARRVGLLEATRYLEQ